jgi:hypothetical protein
LLKEFNDLAKRNAFDNGITDNKEPDKAWLIVAIAHLKPDHEIFGKSYQPPVKEVARDQYTINNADKFFTDLPPLTKKRDLKCISRIPEY